MSFVTLEHRGPVGLITMNRPEALNALNDQVLRDLDASQADCARIRLSALSAEEAAEYERLSSKVQSQIKKILE